jgi:hypothetical protein
MTPDDAFTESAAAYVLGALSLDERHAFELHLRHCDACTRAVSELAGMPALLRQAQLPDTAGEAPGPVPIGVLSGLAARVARRRRRFRIALSAGVAACVLVVLAVVLPQVGEIDGVPSPTGVAMTAVVDTPMHVTAALHNVAWGTKIDLNCSYDSKMDTGYGAVYALEVTGDDGLRQQVATWRAVPGKVSVVDAATALHRNEISGVQVTESGQPILRLPR